ncbi:hypothetical protein [Planktothricoides raciborskii]|uniref:hypothetical protein n=1 Tax=Planktothricoides raciborskii TaxID=132608 RepID=UPI00339BEC07
MWTRDGEERQTLIGHSTITWDATFSPYGQIIAFGDDNNLIKLWNQNGEELQTWDIPLKLMGFNLVPMVRRLFLRVPINQLLFGL